MLEEPMQGETIEVPNQEGSVPTGGGAAPIGEGLAQVQAAAIDVLPCTNDIDVNEVEPQLGHASGGDASAPGFPRGPGSRSPRDTTLGDAISAPGSSHIVDSGATELGLPGYMRALLLPAS
jgi:hypothetical protein